MHCYLLLALIVTPSLYLIFETVGQLFLLKHITHLTREMEKSIALKDLVFDLKN